MEPEMELDTDEIETDEIDTEEIEIKVDETKVDETRVEETRVEETKVDETTVEEKDYPLSKEDQELYRQDIYELLTRAYLIIPIEGPGELSQKSYQQLNELAGAWAYFNITQSKRFEQIMPPEIKALDVVYQLMKLIPLTFHQSEGEWRELADQFVWENLELIKRVLESLYADGSSKESSSKESSSKESSKESSSKESSSSKGPSPEQIRSFMMIVHLVLRSEYSSKIQRNSELRVEVMFLSRTLIMFVRTYQMIFERLYERKFIFDDPGQVIDLILSDLFDVRRHERMMTGTFNGFIFKQTIQLRALGKSFVEENFVQLNRIARLFHQQLVLPSTVDSTSAVDPA